MATNANFNEMLKRYMPYEMLVERMKKKNYFWNKVSKKQGWNGNVLEVPFEGGEYSSLNFGGLTASTDVAEGTYCVGTISSTPELWGTMKFNEKDLDRHGDLEKSYLAIVPGKIDQFVGRMSERVSMNLLGDGSIAKATVDGTNAGLLAVDRPENFTIGEKIVVDDDNSSPVTGYVTAINMSTNVLTIKDARTAGAAVDLSTYTVAQNAKVFLPNAQASGFTSLKSQLLPASAGGSATLFGKTKTDYPFLQAQAFSGASMTAANALDKILDFYYDTVQRGKSEPTEILCSFAIFKAIAKKLEANRQGVSATEKSAGYGWRSVNIIGSEGEMKITALRDMATTEMYILDWNGLDFHGDKFFERKRHLDNNEFFMERATTGYSYLVDIKFYGDLVVSRPSGQGIVHSIDPAQFA